MSRIRLAYVYLISYKMGVNKTLQGNLDPSLLLAPWDVIEQRVREILDEGMERGKHILI